MTTAGFPTPSASPPLPAAEGIGFRVTQFIANDRICIAWLDRELLGT